MINRVLIRTKVVQLLYSHLLIDKQFMIESYPSAPTKEKRFAYNLYLQILWLFLKLADNYIRNGKKPLEETSFIKKLHSDEKIKSLLKSEGIPAFIFASLVNELTDKMKESLLLKDYFKSNISGSEIDKEDKIWENIFNQIIYPDPSLNELITKMENYSLRGVERMKEMMDVTFSNFYSSRGYDFDALKILEKSMEKARELYMRLLLLPIDLTDLRYQQLSENKGKFLASQEDLNPNTRFIDNRLIGILRDEKELIDYADRHKISWLAEDRQGLGLILKEIMDSDIYKDYMNAPVSDLKEDCEFWRDIFKQVIFRSSNFLEDLESKSVFWNDDLEIIGTFILKTFKKIEEGSEGKSYLLPMYKDEEDSLFGRNLFSQVVKNKELYKEYIDEFIAEDRWDFERLALMDVIITMTAMAEIINFPKIPLNVSINEYIEIAKSYSSPKSGAFVNGLLKSIVEKLRTQGIINKKFD